MVSVVLPVYNGEKYIGACLDSLLQQSYEDFEIVLMDDCSTDNTAHIISGYSDSRIRYFKNEENKGIVCTLNKAFNLCQGDYIARMDADDICMPDRLKAQVEFLENNPNVDMVSCWFEMFGEASGVVQYAVDPEEVKCRLLFSLQLLHPGWMLRRKMLDHGQIYRDEYKYAEDWDFLIRASRFATLANVPQVLMRYRINPNQVSNVYSEPQKKAAERVARNQLEYLGIKLDEKAFSVYLRGFCGKSLLTTEQMNLLIDVLEQIESQNEEARFYQPQLLHKVIQERVFDLCYFNLMYRYKSGLKWFNNFYRKGFRLGVVMWLKLVARGLFTAVFSLG